MQVPSTQLGITVCKENNYQCNIREKEFRKKKKTFVQSVANESMESLYTENLTLRLALQCG